MYIFGYNSDSVGINKNTKDPIINNEGNIIWYRNRFSWKLNTYSIMQVVRNVKKKKNENDLVIRIANKCMWIGDRQGLTWD